MVKLLTLLLNERLSLSWWDLDGRDGSDVDPVSDRRVSCDAHVNTMMSKTPNKSFFMFFVEFILFASSVIFNDTRCDSEYH